MRHLRQPDRLRAGVERIAEEVSATFPDKRVIVLSSDFPGGAERLRAELQTVAEGGCDIVVGTQLVAKGHNFPHLTLVGVLDADIGLTSGDPPRRRAHLPAAPAGDGPRRARREAGPGPGPDLPARAPVISALISGDAERFYAEETAAREVAGLPPFGRLAALVISCTDREAAEAHGRALARVAEPPPGVMVLGRRKRRSRWFAAATASASWSRPNARSTSRAICAIGSPGGRR